MDLGFFTMPIHPVGKDWRTSLAEDRKRSSWLTSLVSRKLCR